MVLIQAIYSTYGDFGDGLWYYWPNLMSTENFYPTRNGVIQQHLWRDHLYKHVPLSHRWYYLNSRESSNIGGWDGLRKNNIKTKHSQTAGIHGFVSNHAPTMDIFFFFEGEERTHSKRWSCLGMSCFMTPEDTNQYSISIHIRLVFHDISISISICLSFYLSIYTCVDLYMYSNTYACMYIYIYVYT